MQADQDWNPIVLGRKVLGIRPAARSVPGPRGRVLRLNVALESKLCTATEKIDPGKVHAKNQQHKRQTR